MTVRLRPGPVRPLLRALVVAGSVAAGLLVACDDDPLQGPGALIARVDAPSSELGSAVLEVRGSGIRGFEAAGDARVFARDVGDGSWRVVVADPGGGELLVRIRVDDVAGPLPSTVITSAADTANAVLSSGVSTTVGHER